MFDFSGVQMYNDIIPAKDGAVFCLRTEPVSQLHTSCGQRADRVNRFILGGIEIGHAVGSLRLR